MSGLGFATEGQEHWKGMPEFRQADLMPHQSVLVHFRSPEDRKAFAELVGRTVTNRTQSIWYPREEIGRIIDKRFTSEKPLNPHHPIYIVSKGRWESRLTSKALEKLGMLYHIVVEPQEYDNYVEVIDEEKILTLPFGNLGKGSIPARNWIWEHSLESGAAWHWILDDNIDKFFRLYNNLKTPVVCGNIFRAAEEFVGRYENVVLSGFNYFMFAKRKQVIPPFYLNTRIYSCILIRNDIPYRWRGRYNEDTDLSLRVLKDGWCTVLFNAFLAMKMPTMTMKGGNTEELYQGDGRWRMAKSLQEQHPDVVKITRKWGRWQHHVNYKLFRKNRLKLKSNTFVPEGVNNYGMYLEVDSEEREPISEGRLLLIGQAPGRSGDASDPLGGKIAKRLAGLAKISIERYEEITERMNLFDEWPGKKGKGDAWDAKAAKKKADLLKDSLQDRTVLFVGRNVAEAFGCSDLPWLEWRESEFAKEVAAIPHPSGVVLWWNDVDNRKAAGEFLRDTFNCNEDE